MSGNRAEEAAKIVFEDVGVNPSPDQTEQIAKIIEQAMIQAYRDSAESCAKVAQQCCSPDLDLAHKIAEEIKRSNIALIANLSSMR